GTVTMYTEELKGNLFGLIPITFSPTTPPPPHGSGGTGPQGVGPGALPHNPAAENTLTRPSPTPHGMEA
ncbi:hypothetical protein, partial [Streptomyces sp. NPDC096193]|uniref:hypothetical protein n=1 Tax=Streptomyces sp. NPDC096193 TaxID=3155821 RepID=UPI0033337514